MAWPPVSWSAVVAAAKVLARPVVVAADPPRSRAEVTYATGSAIPTGTHQWRLVLTRRIHPLRPGRYILTLRSRHGGRRILERTPITIT